MPPDPAIGPPFDSADGDERHARDVAPSVPTSAYDESAPTTEPLFELNRHFYDPDEWDEVETERRAIEPPSDSDVTCPHGVTPDIECDECYPEPFKEGWTER